MIGLDGFNDPVSFHYEMRTPFGYMAQDLSVDIKILLSEDSYVPAIGEQLWRAVIATAINHEVHLDLMWYVRWLRGPLALPWPPLGSTNGRQFGAWTPKDETPIVLMHTGHADDYAARRLFAPAAPRTWVEDTILSKRGWDSMMMWAHGIKMGLAADEIGGDLQHIIAYPGIVPASIENPAGVLFRRVTHLKVVQYTDKAPDGLPSGLWP
jgi:hypothetical protein